MTNFERCEKEFKHTIQNLPELGSEDKKAGIYCLYLESPSIINQIPIYIGQSKNMYGRLLQHQRGLDSITKLNGIEITILNSSPCVYYGCGMSCGALYVRMFDTILASGITDPNDVILRAKVIESCDTCNLQERENYYIKKYGADAYGFNQPIVSEWLHRVRRYPSKYGILQILDWVVELVSTQDTNDFDAGEQYVFDLALSAVQSVYYIYQKMNSDNEINERFKILEPFIEEYKAISETLPSNEDIDGNDCDLPANYQYEQALYWNLAGERMSSKMEEKASRALCSWLNDYREILRQHDLNSYKLRSWGTLLRYQITLNQQPVRYERYEQIMNFLDSIKNENILEIQRRTLYAVAKRHKHDRNSSIFIDDFGLRWSV